MNSPWAGTLIFVAAVGTVLALLAGPNLAVATPAAAVAVLAAGALFVGLWSERPRRSSVVDSAPGHGLFQFRYGFRSGRFGRLEIVSALDRIERSAPETERPIRTTGELETLIHLSPTDFRAYVGYRLDELEALT